MKTRIFKSVLPAVMLFTAVAGAFASANANKKAPLAQENGFIHLTSETSCDASIRCRTEAGDLCMTTDGYQVWKKNNSNQCVVELYRIP